MYEESGRLLSEDPENGLSPKVHKNTIYFLKQMEPQIKKIIAPDDAECWRTDDNIGRKQLPSPGLGSTNKEEKR